MCISYARDSSSQEVYHFSGYLKTKLKCAGCFLKHTYPVVIPSFSSLYILNSSVMKGSLNNLDDIKFFGLSRMTREIQIKLELSLCEKPSKLVQTK